MDTIYKVGVEFVGEASRLIERKDFYFTSKDAEVDFVAEIKRKNSETILYRYEIAAYGRDSFMVALNDLERAKVRPVRA